MENEKRLIDANALSCEIDSCSFETSYDCEKVLEIIAEAPTVDAVEVVRCKDCKHGEFVDDGFSLYLCHHHGSDWNDGEHFCSYGERKDNG